MFKDERIKKLFNSFIDENDEKNVNVRKAKRDLVKLTKQRSATKVVELFDVCTRDFFDDMELDLSSIEM